MKKIILPENDPKVTTSGSGLGSHSGPSFFDNTCLIVVCVSLRHTLTTCMDRVSSCQLLWAQRRCCIINVLTWGPGSPGIPLGPGWPLTPLAPCRDNMDSMTLVTISQSDYHNVSDLIAHLWTWSTWGARESWSSWLSRWTLQEHTHRDTHTVSAGCLSDDWGIKQD